MGGGSEGMWLLRGVHHVIIIQNGSSLPPPPYKWRKLHTKVSVVNVSAIIVLNFNKISTAFIIMNVKKSANHYFENIKF